MAPVASTVLSHADGISDSARARELYKYYQPNAPINQETCFPSTERRPSLPQERGETLLGAQVHSDITSSKISSPDTALTAFCQLVTWRLGAQRAMISLIDADTQYFIAESTKTIDLVDNTSFAPGDELWLGCTSVAKAGRLCERTIAAAPTATKDIYPSFIVNDLSKDDRFSDLPFVKSPPHLKFYAGVPLITKRKIPIGSLFVVDDRARDDLGKTDINFLGTMAETIMRHLEIVREVEEHRRGMKMSRGLASFVEGRAELVEAEVEAELEAEDSEGSRVVGQFETEATIVRAHSKGSTHGSNRSHVGSVTSVERKEREYSSALAKSEEAMLDASYVATGEPTERSELGDTPYSIDAASQGVISPETRDNTALIPSDNVSEASAMRTLFSRAANLIREAFEVDGGVVFYDAQRGSLGSPRGTSDTSTRDLETDSSRGRQTDSDELGSAGEQGPEPVEAAGVSPSVSPLSGSTPSPGGVPGPFSRSSVESKNPCEILGFSTSHASSIHGDDIPGAQSFQILDNKALQTLLKRFPRGKLWTFDSDGTISSSSEEESQKRRRKGSISQSQDAYRRKLRSARSKDDARYLSRRFPGVRQLLFVPLWDAGRLRWLSGCFVWSTEPTRVLSKQSELAFLSAFGNSVMAECSRIDTEIADQKKSDFIGSISHELRSPLHGILASAEFLSEEELNSFQKGLVETIDSCGRTLLDTINHILDFSKINQFERVWRKNKRSGRAQFGGDGALSLRKSDLPMVNLFAEVDISVICEEVVEGVFAGHVFQNLTAGNFDIVPAPRGKMSDPATTNLASTSGKATPKSKSPTSQVQVIFDVDMQSYNFVTQPGAFRRVIMNLLGNALKYTSHGYVSLKLVATPMEPLHNSTTGEVVPRSLITVRIKDTGRGISSEFLRSKVFTPFAQENSLSSGTGLGLSIVRSIIALLEGEITIDSEIGRGTEVRVTLPLLHDMPKSGDTTSSHHRSTSSGPRDNEDAIKQLRAQVVGRKVALHGFEIDSPDPVIKEMYAQLKASVTNFLTKWYGFQVVPLGSRTNLIISNEATPSTVSTLARQSASLHRNNPTILVLCSQNDRLDRDILPSGSRSKIGYVAKPVGPLKLAKAIMLCLEGDPPLLTPGPEAPFATPAISNDLTNIFEELSFASHGELLDNSRMATDSANARKAIESPTPNALLDKHAEFPFPVAAPPDERPKAHSMPGSKDSLPLLHDTGNKEVASEKLASMELASKKVTASGKTTDRRSAPSLLLVDDNKINLRLLKAYVLKKKYPVIDEAENGLEAVKKFTERKGGYDIIFMDISMPILDGFGATKQIRAVEKSRRQKQLAEKQNLKDLSIEGEGITDTTSTTQEGQVSKRTETKDECLIIALTGLASGRDQQEAANVGVDIFLTKPVSFKEVGRLLDNWEANNERAASSP